jgi:hypothetical protein
MSDFKIKTETAQTALYDAAIDFAITQLTKVRLPSEEREKEIASRACAINMAAIHLTHAVEEDITGTVLLEVVCSDCNSYCGRVVPGSELRCVACGHLTITKITIDQQHLLQPVSALSN